MKQNQGNRGNRGSCGSHGGRRGHEIHGSRESHEVIAVGRGHENNEDANSVQGDHASFFEYKKNEETNKKTSRYCFT